ncbi:TonB family protein [Marinobacter sp.]|uniref:TonB family protein n=1 Tax=Marinobacter sp. TaxID=50741 RepID=UPI0019E0A641|nr:TonB family protein [Marinobacter sp.]MBE0486336.1 TonB family protein [Marinobacter sp.]
MSQVSKRAKLLFMTIAISTTAITLVLAAPDKPMELATLGDQAVNSAPAIKINLAGRKAPEPDVSPEPEPEPIHEPKPEPEPESVPEPEPVPTPVEQPKQPVAEAADANISEPTGEETDAQESQSTVPLQTAGESSDVDSYLSKLSRHLARFYSYPRRARQLGQEGTPVVVFEFARDGSLISHTLRDSSGHQLLDDAALQMLAQAAPLPEVPDNMRGQNFTYALPVRFSLR